MRQLEKLCIFAMVCILTAPASAAVSSEEAAKMGMTGTELTPMGAIRAGTEDGKIPSWEGGITEVPAGYKAGGWYVDPYKDDVPLFRITKDNYPQYAEWLTDGQVGMFKTYPETYWMDVYPSRRSVSFMKRIYEATMRNAREQKLCGERCIVPNEYGGGFPFPIPSGTDQEKGLQMLFNTFPLVLFPAGARSVVMDNARGFLVNADGSFIPTSTKFLTVNPWWATAEERAESRGEIYRPNDREGTTVTCSIVQNIEPARSNGALLSACNYSATMQQKIFAYVAGQRRVRRAPELGTYDAPGNNSDGLRTSDAALGAALSGAEERYDYKYHGKKIKIIPYNNYKATDPNLKETDVVRAGHINPEIVRYEFHRVHESERTLKPGFRHLSPHRFEYFEEDSWRVPLAHMYNTRGELWRVSEVMSINAYDLPGSMVWSDAHYDVINGRWFASGNGGWFNLGPNPQPVKMSTDKDLFDVDVMTPQGLRDLGVR